ncbi:hypothetical protein [Mesorhizobium sp. LjRoot246]|uniref:hypothetical protein n=1 Tax=Mesorhizobium sp. LjRoot246 TaxID=3342294 RepID=UPI003ECE850D
MGNLLGKKAVDTAELAVVRPSVNLSSKPWGTETADCSGGKLMLADNPHVRLCFDPVRPTTKGRPRLMKR